MSDILKCSEHNIDLRCMGGRSAHISNWYCPICDFQDDVLSALSKHHSSEELTEEVQNCVKQHLVNL